VCCATSIINRIWQACSVSTSRTLTCCSTFSNNRWAISVIHHDSSCWAPLHVTLSKATAMWWRLDVFEQLLAFLRNLHICAVLHGLIYNSFNRKQNGVRLWKHNNITSYLITIMTSTSLTSGSTYLRAMWQSVTSMSCSMQTKWVWSPQSDHMQSGQAMNIYWSQRAQIKSKSIIFLKKTFCQLHNLQFNYLKAIYISWM
jgi:hypothetical protein